MSTHSNLPHIPTADVKDPDLTVKQRTLLKEIANNDANALEQLMQLYTDRLLAFATSIVGDSDVAEEVVQDVFISVWDHRTSLVVRESVASYLFRAVRNRALSAVRREHAYERAKTESMGLYDDSMFTTRNLSETSAEHDDVQFTIARVLRSLPPRCREIFILNWEHDLSYREIADILDIGVPTVRNQFYRATKQLMEYFERLRNSR